MNDVPHSSHTRRFGVPEYERPLRLLDRGGVASIMSTPRVGQSRGVDALPGHLMY
jgi:hypothetical protein